MTVLCSSNDEVNSFRKRKLPETPESGIPSKVWKQGTSRAAASSTVTSGAAVKADKEEDLIKKQNDAIYKIRDYLNKKYEEKVLKKKDLADLLAYNEEDFEGGTEVVSY